MSSSSGSVYDLDEFQDEITFHEQLEVIDNTKVIIDDDMLESEISYLLVSYHPNRREYSHVRRLKQIATNYIEMFKKQQTDSNELHNLVPIVAMKKRMFPQRGEKEQVRFQYEYDKIVIDEHEHFVTALNKLFKNDRFAPNYADKSYSLFVPFEPMSGPVYHLKKDTDGIYLWEDEEAAEMHRLLGEQRYRMPEEKLDEIEYKGDALTLLGFISRADPAEPIKIKRTKRFDHDKYLEHLRSLKKGDKVMVFAHAAEAAEGRVDAVGDDNTLVISIGKKKHTVNLTENICNHDAFYYGDSWKEYQYSKSKLLVDTIYFKVPSAAQDHIRMMTLTAMEHVYALEAGMLNKDNAHLYESWDALRRAIPDIDKSSIKPSMLTSLLKAAAKLTAPKKKRAILSRRKMSETTHPYLKQVELDDSIANTNLMRLRSILGDSYKFILYNIPKIKVSLDAKKSRERLDQLAELKKTKESPPKPPAGTVFADHEELLENPPASKKEKALLDIGRFYQPLIATKDLEWKADGELIEKHEQVKHSLPAAYAKARKDIKPRFVDKFFADHELDTSPSVCLDHLKTALRNAKARFTEISQQDMALLMTRYNFKPPPANQLVHVNHVNYNGRDGDEEYVDFDELANNDEGYGKQFHAVVANSDDEGDDDDADPDGNQNPDESLLIKIGTLLRLHITKADYEYIKKTLDSYVSLDSYLAEEPALLKRPPDHIQKLMQNSKYNKEALNEYKKQEVRKLVMAKFYKDQSLYIFALLVIFIQIKLPEVILDPTLQACANHMSLDGYPMLANDGAKSITNYMAALMQFLARKGKLLYGVEVFSNFKKPIADVQADLKACIGSIIDDRDLFRIRLNIAEAAWKAAKDKNRRETETKWKLYHEGELFRPFTGSYDAIKSGASQQVGYIAELVDDVKSKPQLRIGADRVVMQNNACCMQTITPDIKLYAPLRLKEQRRKPRILLLIKKKAAAAASAVTQTGTISLPSAQLIKKEKPEAITSSEELVKQVFMDSQLFYNKQEINKLFEMKRGVWSNLSNWVEKRLGDLQFALQQKQIKITCFAEIVKQILGESDQIAQMAERFVKIDFLGTLSRVANGWKEGDPPKRHGIDLAVLAHVLTNDQTTKLLQEVDTEGMNNRLIAQVLLEAGKLCRFDGIENRFNQVTLVAVVMVLCLEWIVYVSFKDDLNYQPESESLTSIIQRSKHVNSLKSIVRIVEVMCNLFANKSRNNLTSYERIRDMYEYQRETLKRNTMERLQKMDEETRRSKRNLVQRGLANWDDDMQTINESGEQVEDAAVQEDHAVRDDDYVDDDDDS